MINIELDKSFLDKSNKNAKTWYIEALSSSPLYRIEYSDLPIISPSGFCIKVNKKKLIYFSVTDRGKRLLRQENQKLIDVGVDLVIVPQRNEHKQWEQREKDLNISFLPFPMYPDSSFKFERNFPSSMSKIYTGFLSGRVKWDRPTWHTVAKKIPQISCLKLTHSQYLEVLSQTTWGIILAGSFDKVTDPKNRREAEFSSRGLPLALNYKPYYLFPFNEGDHYYYLSSPESLHDLVEMSSEKVKHYSRQSQLVWENYFSPRGIATYFKKIVEEFLL